MYRTKKKQNYRFNLSTLLLPHMTCAVAHHFYAATRFISSDNSTVSGTVDRINAKWATENSIYQLLSLGDRHFRTIFAFATNHYEISWPWRELFLIYYTITPSLTDHRLFFNFVVVFVFECFAFGRRMKEIVSKVYIISRMNHQPHPPRCNLFKTHFFIFSLWCVQRIHLVTGYD